MSDPRPDDYCARCVVPLFEREGKLCEDCEKEARAEAVVRLFAALSESKRKKPPQPRGLKP